MLVQRLNKADRFLELLLFLGCTLHQEGGWIHFISFHANEANEAPEKVFTLLNRAMCFVASTRAKACFAIHSWTKMKQVRSTKLWYIVIFLTFLGNYFKNWLPHKNGYMAYNPSQASETPFLRCYIQHLGDRRKHEDMTSRMLATVPHASSKILRMRST